MVELLIHDRLKLLTDGDAIRLLKFWSKVMIHFQKEDVDSSGRADWVMCHGNPKHQLGTTLVIV